eukprot:gene18383-25900_t
MVKPACLVSPDGIHCCPIQEPSPFSAKWYSHKFHGPGITYEVGLNIRRGAIVWAYGGYPCGEYPDLKLASKAVTPKPEFNRNKLWPGTK